MTIFIQDPDDIRKQLQTVESKFRDAAGTKVTSIEWRATIAYPTEHAAVHARATDLVVTGIRRSGSPYRAADPASLIMVAGRPVLLVPDGVSQLAADRVVIAWKDTREARRAVLDCLPLLVQASDVIVAFVTEGADAAIDSAADVAGFLRRHAVNATPFRIDADGSPGERIIAFAGERGADLIVAGAYGHSRLREWIFGGVTRDLLHRSPICCLMAN
jgi:nucleotide-binding universal stress UspA family protein